MSCSELLREFALQPSLLNNWKDFRFYFDHFGIHRGRLISRFPKKWKRMVYESVSSNVGEIDRKRIEERLKFIDDKMIRMNREYDGNQNWLQNAEQSYNVFPFHAIIASENPDNHEYVLISDNIDEQNTLWRVDTEFAVPRNPESLAVIVSQLFQISHEIFFIDPHFGPDAGRFRITLEHFLETAFRTGNHFSRIEFHLAANATSEFFETECNARLPHIIPDGIAVTFKRWRQLDQSERLHPRYILTDKGGFRFEGGLDAGAEGQTVDVSILNPTLYQQRWADYQTDTAAFEFVDKVEIIGTKRI